MFDNNCMRKTILIVGAGSEQTLAILEAKKMGLYTVACDANSSAPGFSEADEHHVMDIRNVEQLICLGNKLKIDGIFCHAVEIPDVISRVSQCLGLPGLKPFIADRATNKIKRISHLTSCGIPCAHFVIVESPEELNEKAQSIGYPLILKPVDTAGSRGVRLVENQSKIGIAYHEAMSFARTSEVLLESVLSGPEISTESIVYQGQIYTFAFADRNYSRSKVFQPYFVEDGINYPSCLSLDMQQKVYDLVERTIKALGIDFGAAKGDIIIDKGIPKIIEMAARTSGGWFGAGSIPIATGSNMLKPLIQMAVGDVPELEEIKPSRNLACAQRYVIPVSEGVVENVTGVDSAISAPGVSFYTMFLPGIGDRIKKATNHAERYGQIICVGETREKAIERCEFAISQIKIQIQGDHN